MRRNKRLFFFVISLFLSVYFVATRCKASDTDLDLKGTHTGESEFAKLASGKTLTKVMLGPNCSDTLLKQIAEIDTVQEIELEGTPIRDCELLEGLARLPKLKSLTISYNRDLSRCIGNIAKIHGLTNLYVPECDISDNDLPKLSSLSNLRVLSLTGDNISDKGLLGLSNLKHLEAIGLTNTKVTSRACRGLAWSSLKEITVSKDLLTYEFFAGLSAIPSIETLLITFSPKLTDESTGPLHKLRKLKYVMFSDTSVSDDTVRALSNSKGLRTLKIATTNVSSKSAESISQFSDLRVLDLNVTKVDDEIGSAIARLSSLETLKLGATSVTDKIVPTICSLRKLRVLWLGGTKITDSGVDLICNLKSLEELNLNSCKLSDQSTLALQRLPKLKQLSIQGTGLSRKSVEQLSKKRPGCRISSDFDGHSI